MKTFRLPAPAKLNLFLHINGQREDGYHELQTLFQFISLCDYLSFEITENPAIELISDIDSIPVEDNLIFKAASLLQRHQHEQLGTTPKGVKIKLEKNIPMGGGLGGGSSDAATTLVALNILWKIDLSFEQLSQLGLSLGADIPIFIHGHAAWGEGIGEKLTDTLPLTPFYLIVRPQCNVNTSEIFSHKRLTRDTPKLRIAAALEEVLPDPFDSNSRYKNDCENLVCELYPEVKSAMTWLNSMSNARLTGTGSCIYAPFASIQEAEDAALKAPSDVETFAVKALNISPLIECLRELERSSI
jgi:4-diphosphocytidyl-2-C-methyl-D-erythritol kinase